MSILDKIISVDFPSTQYYRVAHPKKQIVLHHTVSGGSTRGDIDWWLQTASRIATCIIIDRNGIPFQCFSSKYWAHHLGVKVRVFNDKGIPSSVSNNLLLNQQSIAIEIDSWGGLVSKNNKWYNAVWNRTFKRFDPGTSEVKNVQYYPNRFRGFKAFEKYTDEQIKTVEELLKFWKNRYTTINYQYKDDIWDVNLDALKGVPGIYTHVSYRSDKSDCHPQTELIEMLKAL